MNNIEQVLELISQQSEVEGALKKEIEHLQSYYKYKFPTSYIRYLSIMGRYADFLEGENCFIDDLPIYLLGTNNIFKRNKIDFEVTELQMVFSSLQGTACWYFNLNEGENPPVYFYMEGIDMKKPVKVAASFSDYVFKKYRQNPNLFSIVNKHFCEDLEGEEEQNNDDDLPF